MNVLSKIQENNNFLKSVYQFTLFCIVGISNTLVNISVYYILIFFGVYYLISNTVAFLLSVLNAYYWNNKFVFKKSKTVEVKPLSKTFLSYLCTFLLGSVLLFIFVHYLHIPESIAPLINIIIMTPVNFILNKFWIFKSK